jgi:hypothetical protein
MSLGDNANAQAVAGMGGSEVVWIDSLHIGEEKGQDVFQYEQESIDKLIAYLENDENDGSDVEPIVDEVMEMLHRADRLLASVAIDESACGSEIIAEADELIAEADSYWETGRRGLRADNAYDKLEEAWEKATHC